MPSSQRLRKSVSTKGRAGNGTDDLGGQLYLSDVDARDASAVAKLKRPFEKKALADAVSRARGTLQAPQGAFAVKDCLALMAAIQEDLEKNNGASAGQYGDWAKAALGLALKNVEKAGRRSSSRRESSGRSACAVRWRRPR